MAIPSVVLGELSGLPEPTARFLLALFCGKNFCH